MLRSERLTQPNPRDLLHDLAHRISRLRPDHRNPHHFHEEKSEIAHALATLASHPSWKEAT